MGLITFPLTYDDGNDTVITCTVTCKASFDPNPRDLPEPLRTKDGKWEIEDLEFSEIVQFASPDMDGIALKSIPKAHYRSVSEQAMDEAVQRAAETL